MWVAAVVGMSPGGAGAQAERPEYQRLRYDEDWSMLHDPARRTEPLDSLKYIALTEDGWAWLSLGGEARQRYEYTRNPLWGEDPQDEHGVVLQRYVLHADVRVGPHIRVFGQFLSALEDGRAGPPSPVDENELDVQQAFIDLGLEGGLGRETRVTLRLGRQEMAYGSSRLVDVREGPNVRRKFDGGRLLLHLGPEWRLDTIAVRPAQIEPGVFDDGIDDRQALWGVYLVGAPAGLPTGVDVYYLGYRNDDGRYDQGMARETRHTVGARFWGGEAGWDWNWELFWQWGTFGTGNIRAWSVASDTGYTWQTAPWTPRLGLSANVASGDEDRSDADLQTFNPLFPRGNYFSELALLGPRNFYNVHPSVVVRPSRHVTITLDVDFFWRLETGDGIYNPGGGLLRSGADSNAHYVGTELSLNATWQLNRQVSLTGIYSHFFPGRFIRETGPAKDIDFVEITLRAIF